MKKLLPFLLLASCVTPPARPPLRIEDLAEILIVGEPRISPDGRTVAFISDKTGTPEVWVVAASGGTPRQLTHFKENVAHLRWSVDGKSIFGVTDRGGNERYDLFQAEPDGTTKVIAETPRSETEPEPSPDGRWLAFTADADVEFHPHLFVRDLTTGKERRLTTEDPPVYYPKWSRDSKRLAVSQTPDDQKGDLLIVELDSGRITRVRPPLQNALLRPVAFGADGRLLCLTQNALGFLQLALVEGTTVRLIGGSEWDVETAAWHPKAGIVFSRNEGGTSTLYRMDDPASGTERLYASTGVIDGINFDSEGRRMCYLEGDVTRPTDVWVREGNQTWPVTRALVSKITPSARGEMIRYKSFDGTEIHALVIRPPISRLGTPPPCIVIVHGGPNDQVRPEFGIRSQSFAEAGFVVLMPNYRGSTGYGRAFEDANNKDWGGGDLKDLVAGLDTLASRGEIDLKRVGITGGSYGGYMTLMALVKTPDVWKAGVEMYGMPDLVADYELTKDRFGTWYETEMGTPQTHAELFKDRSPITHLAAMRAPLMVLQGANDTNVPKKESDLVVETLKKRGHPVEYVVYDNEGHGFIRRENRIDNVRRSVDFFVRHLK